MTEQTPSCIARKLIVAGAALAALSFSSSASAQSDITAPGDIIQLINGYNDGDDASGPPPGAEGVEHAIDNVDQKYLNFLDAASGFAVTPGAGPSIITGARFYTANDEANRDPASVQIEGSLDGINGTYTVIGNWALALPAGRNTGGTASLGTVFQEVTFANTAAYTSYRVIFPTLKNAGLANSMQIAEVELLGTIVPEPSTFALIGLGGGLALLLRNRKNS